VAFELPDAFQKAASTGAGDEASACLIDRRLAALDRPLLLQRALA
jgi:hypothetical protein